MLDNKVQKAFFLESLKCKLRLIPRQPTDLLRWQVNLTKRRTYQAKSLLLSSLTPTTGNLLYQTQGKPDVTARVAKTTWTLKTEQRMMTAATNQPWYMLPQDLAIPWTLANP